MSDAITGVGIILKRGNGATPTETFTSIGELISFGGPNMSKNMTDVTHTTSTNGFREFKAGFKDAGTATATFNFIRDGWDDLLVDFERDGTWNYQLYLPDTGETLLDFAAYVSELSGPTFSDDGKVTSAVTFKLSGTVTLTS